MINEKNKQIWLGAGCVGLYLQIFYQHRWMGGGVQMPTLTEENSQFVRSWPQEDSRVMDIFVLIVVCIC